MPNLPDDIKSPLDVLTFRCEAPDRTSPDGRCRNQFTLTHAFKKYCCSTCQTRAYRANHPRTITKPPQPPKNRELKFNITPRPFSFDPTPAPVELPKPVENPAPTGDELFDNWLKKGD